MKNAIRDIESAPTGAAAWAAAFLGVMLVRFLLENFSSPPPSGFLTSDLPTLVHYSLFFLTLALALSLVVAKFARRPVVSILRLAPYGLIVTWLPPIADLAVSGGKGLAMAYLFDPPSRLIADFLTFFGPLVVPGITLGMRLEVLLVLAAVFWYVGEATGSRGRAALAALASYAVIFAWVSLPGVVFLLAGASGAGANPVIGFFRAAAYGSTAVTGFLHPTIAQAGPGYDTRFDVIAAQVLYLAAIPLFAAVAWSAGRRSFLAALRNSRPERVAHYFLMFGLGTLVAFAGGGRYLSWADGLAVLGTLAAIYFAWMFAVGVNDLADVVIDRVSNPSRPFVAGAMSDREMGAWNLFFLAWSLLGAWLGGSHVYFLLLVFTSAYYVYSAPPLRLKRVPGIATFLISLACLSTAMAGFFLARPGAPLAAFPARLAWCLVVVFTLAANVKDVKDVAGDAREGILTVPTMLGENRGKIAVGLLLCLSFWLVPLFLGGAGLYLTSVPAGVAGFFIVTRKRYREWPVFALYFAYALASAAFVTL